MRLAPGLGTRALVVEASDPSDHTETAWGPKCGGPISHGGLCQPVIPQRLFRANLGQQIHK